MPSQGQILEAIKNSPGGLTTGEIATSLGVKSPQIGKLLSDLCQKGMVAQDTATGLYTVTDKGRGIKLPVAVKPVLPLEYDKFYDLGSSVGVTEPLLKSICDYIFAQDPNDVTKVHEALLRLSLRPDIAGRWTSLWAAFLGKPVPKAVDPAAATSSDKEKKFCLVGNQIMADPEGDLTHSQALKELEIRLSHQGQSSGDNELLKGVLEELKNVRQTMIDQQIQSLASTFKDGLTAVNSRVDGIAGDKKEASRFGVLEKSVDKVGVELSGWRGDLKALVPTFLAARGQTIKHRTEEEKAKFSVGLDKGIARSKAATEAENKLWPELMGAQQGVVVAAPPTREAPPACFTPGYVSGVYGCGEVKRGDPNCQKCSYAPK